ncbi:hypothetical protein FO519_000203 [Halicephalobus sp. NKZ332]|nr:hypothetical protein FO519_000203 [Halicephalobus sp. NKZ332]
MSNPPPYYNQPGVQYQPYGQPYGQPYPAGQYYPNQPPPQIIYRDAPRDNGYDANTCWLISLLTLCCGCLIGEACCDSDVDADVGLPLIVCMLTFIRRTFASVPVVYTHRSGRRVKERLARAMERGNSNKLVLKVPKGTQDFGPREAAVREAVKKQIIDVFKIHGGEEIDTPVFEMRDILQGKFGEEAGKLIYNLEDQGGELYSMRYDLTVPFARYLAMNKIQSMKRYQISKVYRRDNPAMTRGRFREFYQCDFDIAGQHEALLPEAECVRIVAEVLTKLDIGTFEIKLNHRQLLEGLMESAGISAKDFKPVASSIDKLDKVPSWDSIAEELTKEKNIDPEAVNRLGTYICYRQKNPKLTNSEYLEHVLQDPVLNTNPKVTTAVKELEKLSIFMDSFGVSQSVFFDPSLARGLDYYTGVIYEAVVKGFTNASTGDSGGKSAEQIEENNVGSVAAGGRYDNLVAMLLGAKGGKSNVPCCGVSFGIERLFAIIQKKLEEVKKPIRTVETDIYIASAQKGMLVSRLKIIRQMWDHNLRAETSFKANPKLLDQLQYCESRMIPFALIIGEEELAKNVCKVREIGTRDELTISLTNIEQEVSKFIDAWKSGSKYRPTSESSQPSSPMSP